MNYMPFINLAINAIVLIGLIINIRRLKKHREAYEEMVRLKDLHLKLKQETIDYLQENIRLLTKRLEQ